MLKPSAAMLLGLLLAMPLAAQETAADPAAAAAAAAADNAKTADVLAAFRDELQSLETEVVSKSIALTTDEATRFWPVFQQFQAEQRQVIDAQMAAIHLYANDYATLSDDESVAYVNALLERDQRIHDLRVKYLAEYARVIAPGKAARVIHITRRLGLASQVKLANSIPLIRVGKPAE